MTSRTLAQNLFRCSNVVRSSVVSAAPRIGLSRTHAQLPFNHQSSRFFQTTRVEFAAANSSTGDTTSAAAEAITTPQARPTPDQETYDAKHAAFLGEADSNDGFEALKDSHGDPPPALDAQNSAFLGEADSDDGFESRKDVDGERLEAVDATNSAFLGEADSDDGFVAHRDAHPEEGDHKIVNPEESGLHGSPGEGDQ